MFQTNTEITFPRTLPLHIKSWPIHTVRRGKLRPIDHSDVRRRRVARSNMMAFRSMALSFRPFVLSAFM